MTPIKIITINTWKCDGRYDARLRLLAWQLAEQNPDLIACQECFMSEEAGADTLKFLAGELKMHYHFLPGRNKKRRLNGELVDSFSGLGVLSRFPLTLLGGLELPSVADDDDRQVQIMEVALPGETPLLLANTHLTHVRGAENFRAAQAKFVAEQVAAYPHRYRIICGDMNAQPGSSTIKAFKETPAIDCYQAGHGPEPSYSVTDAYEGDQLIRIDHILSLPYPGTTEYPEFSNSNIVLNQKVEGIYPSDHFGISTTLLINNQQL